MRASYGSHANRTGLNPVTRGNGKARALPIWRRTRAFRMVILSSTAD